MWRNRWRGEEGEVWEEKGEGRWVRRNGGKRRKGKGWMWRNGRGGEEGEGRNRRRGWEREIGGKR